MDNLSFIYSILSELDIVIFRREGIREYTLAGHVPDFYRRLYPAEESSICAEPWKHSDLLDFFMEDAEVFFSINKEGHLASGIWQESGVDGNSALMAHAVIKNGEKTIVLRRLSEEYLERVRILQKARENLLERRILNTNLEKYKKIAQYDALTNIYNRATFLDILKKVAGDIRGSKESLSLLMVDVDNFKHVNDTYGHLAGDAVLSNLGLILSSGLRDGDIVARYGGEEFIILATKTNREQVFYMAENLRKKIEVFSFPRPERITVSIGCTEFRRPESIKDFIQRADFALYDAKAANKNIVKIR